jgi:hypothetical protein
MKKPIFNKIEAIRAHKFVGNAFSDMPAFFAICDFTDDVNHSVQDRVEALRIMARKGMGLSGEDAGDNLSDDVFLAEYELSKE